MVKVVEFGKLSVNDRFYATEEEYKALNPSYQKVTYNGARRYDDKIPKAVCILNVEHPTLVWVKSNDDFEKHSAAKALRDAGVTI